MPQTKFGARVIKVTKNPVVDGPQGGKIGLFTVDAKVDAPEYAKDIFVIQIVGSAALGSRQTEKGFLMENGEFQFASVDELAVGDEVEITVSPSVRSGLIE
jgi:hypothetical protein